MCADEMSNLVEQVISENYESLKKDLQDDIIESCKHLLEPEEQKQLEIIENEEDRISCFLNMLRKKSFTTLKLFISSLETWYNWLHERMNDSLDKIDHKDLTYQTHRLGGVPDLPYILVSRKSLLDELKTKLISLQKGHYLVLHGMIGCGKTALAIEALSDSDVLCEFGYQVFWFNVGSDGSDDPMYLLQELNARLPDPLPHLSSSVHLATIELNKRFMQKNWNDSLIVLDDVTNSSIIRSFDIGAKYLIITKDEGVVSKLHKHITKMKVDEGLTQEESLTLIAKALKIDVQNLPHYAEQVHEYTKGHPFLLSLFVSQLQENREHFLEREERWEHYIGNDLKGRKRGWLKKKKLSFKLCGVSIPQRPLPRKTISETDLYFKYIEESVKSLDNEDQEFFRRLAVFQEDVNIKPEVLAILWSTSEVEAENMMKKFVDKSLAVRKWNELQKSYVYGIHDLIGLFLKNDLTSCKEKDLHKRFVESYIHACGSNWSKLPRNDNYIFYYIGYHLDKAQMYDLFPKLYFDLEFLEAKLRVTGPADLLGDFNKYKSRISKSDTKKVVDYRNFIEHYGIWIKKGVNILQAALQTAKSSEVNLCAKELIRNSHPSHRFLRCIAPFADKPVEQTLTLKSKIVAVCFGRTTNEVIIASEDKKILELYNFKMKTVTIRFSGHTGAISNLDLFSSKTYFLSSSLDNTVRIWSLEMSENSSGERTPSPQGRQEDYTNFFSTESIGKKAEHTLPHKSPVTFSLFGKSSYHLVASLCFDGKIILWKDWKKSWENNFYCDVKSIDFCNNDNFLVAATASGRILFFCSKTGNRTMDYDHNFSDVISLTAISGGMSEGLALLCKNVITYYQAAYNEDFNSSSSMDAGTQSPFSKLLSAGPYIVVKTEDGSLHVLQSLNGEKITYFQTKKKVVTFCVSESAVLAAYDDGNLFLYPLKSMRTPLTRLKWMDSSEPVVAIYDSIQHVLEVRSSETELLTFECSNVEKMDISEDGYAVVAASDGKIFFREGNRSQQIPLEVQNTVPSAIFLLSTLREKFVFLSFHLAKSSSNRNLIWNEQKDLLVELEVQPSVSYACLLKCESEYKLLTVSPLCLYICSLEDGSVYWKIDLDSVPFFQSSVRIQTCVSPERRLIAAISVEGLELYHFNAEERTLKKEGKIINSKHIKNISFSPSGSKLAILEADNMIKVYDCSRKSWLYLSGDDCLPDGGSCLAVSNSGYICYGGQGLVSIISPMNECTTAVADVAYIVADPRNESDVFAVVDKAGHVCKIYQGPVLE